MRKILGIFIVLYMTVAEAATTSVNLVSGNAYFASQTTINSYNDVSITFSGSGILSFDLYMEYGGSIRAIEPSAGYRVLTDYDWWREWKTFYIQLKDSGCHTIDIYGYDGGYGYLRNLKWEYGASLPNESLYKWRENADGTITLTGHKEALEGAIAFPSILDGKKVVALNSTSGGFYDCSNVTSIHIPASITNIVADTFVFPRGSNFKKLTVDAANQVYYASNNILFSRSGVIVASACLQAPVSSKIVLPEAKEIAAGAFYARLPSCSEVVVPEGVTNICQSAFGGCWDVKSISLPKSLKHIGADAFLAVASNEDETWSYQIPINVDSIDELSVIDYDAYWRDGLLMGGHEDYSDRDLYCYVGGAKTTVPIAELRLKDGITRIGHYSLTGAALRYHIPSSVREVSSTFFARDCSYYFEGDAPQLSYWNGNSKQLSGTIYVSKDSEGWGDVPGNWKGARAKYMDGVEYDLLLDPNGGQCSANSVRVVSGKIYGVLPSPTRDGYSFAGWYTSGGKSVSATDKAGDDKQLIAQWKALGYKITYVNTKGRTNNNPNSYTVEDFITFRSLESYEGWNFVGWEPTSVGLGSTGAIEVSAIWEEDRPDNPRVVVGNESAPVKAPCQVEIVCDNPRAKIYYTDNGRTPRISEDNLYIGPFEIEESKTIIAVAVIGEFQSEYVTREIVVAPLTLADALDDENADVATGGDSKWFVELNSSAKNGKAVVRSGAIGMEQQTWLEMKVAGRGTLSFWWKVSCEPDPRGKYTYDHVEFAENQETKFRLDGETDWAQETIEFETEGEHTVRWTYLTDDWETAGYNDCAWVDCVVWSPIPTPNLPTELEGASEETKAAFDEWVKKHGVQNPSAANVNAFILGLAPNATEEEIQAQVEAEIENIDLSKLATDPAAAVEAIQAKYPNAKIELKPMENITTSAHLYKLVIDIK